MSELRRRMVADLRIRNYAPATQVMYIRRVQAMAKHLGRSPADLGREEIREYLRLLSEQGASRSTFAQVVGALRFLYRITLDRPEMVPDLPYPREKRRHPVVLSPEEVARLLNAMPNLKHRSVAMVLYGTGLRISEALALELRDGVPRNPFPSSLSGSVRTPPPAGSQHRLGRLPSTPSHPSMVPTTSWPIWPAILTASRSPTTASWTSTTRPSPSATRTTAAHEPDPSSSPSPSSPAAFSFTSCPRASFASATTASLPMPAAEHRSRPAASPSANHRPTPIPFLWA